MLVGTVLAPVLAAALVQRTEPLLLPVLAALIVTASGVQLVAIGVIGQYLGQVHARALGRPTAFVRDTIGFADDAVESLP